MNIYRVSVVSWQKITKRGHFLLTISLLTLLLALGVIASLVFIQPTGRNVALRFGGPGPNVGSFASVPPQLGGPGPNVGS